MSPRPAQALTVLCVGYPFARVSEETAGGAEHVLAMLEQGLVESGHRSVVVAPEGSRCRGALVPLEATRGALSEDAMARGRRACRDAIEEALRSFPVDIVHMHGVDFMEYLPSAGPPLLATLHLPPGWYPPGVFALERPQTYLNCVSDAQLAGCPPSPAMIGAIANGVDLEALRPSRRRDGHVVALGRICPEKGFHLALDAAHRANVPMILAGEVFPYPAHERYFREEILPRLDSLRRFVGPVGVEEKRVLLGRAACLLVPSTAAETSSLVCMEALACGTPVVAFRAGAIPGLIEHGRTGLLVGSASEMADAIPRAAALDRQACRRAAEERFSARHMVSRYLALYGALMDRGRAAGAGRLAANGLG